MIDNDYILSQTIFFILLRQNIISFETMIVGKTEIHLISAF